MAHPINECLTLFTNIDVATSTLPLLQLSHLISSQPSQLVKVYNVSPESMLKRLNKKKKPNQLTNQTNKQTKIKKRAQKKSARL